MGMNVGSESGDDEVVSAINTTPLVDVMLVLLIIFLITIPVAAHIVPVKLPEETNKPNETTPINVNLSIDKNGVVYWNQSAIADEDTLTKRLIADVSKQVPQPKIQIRGDMDANYESIQWVVRACKRAAIQKVGFIVEPPARG
ncbi:ExbD/TolR family protein [Chitinimonas taiwanensis]|jgi:biopolymer transport protein ExbD|uniref:Outer membrane transport energization protein ExbD n=1 Tax=Chitinimonas taiwanensis DSM 18899 TaxID=1121279 RepID=A0A1K2HEM7_9NEIS|nr:biopolymer transporter ExbD [Chitinimonas taiwanensis]SFZ75109.1 outer membrane transport energization protein ExbD [Chitinimonas taiwanensis DSM 18899]